MNEKAMNEKAMNEKLTTIHQLLETSEDFRAWLVSHKMDELVGTSDEADSCPLANYLIDLGIPNPIVRYRTISYLESETNEILFATHEHTANDDRFPGSISALRFRDWIFQFQRQLRGDTTAAAAIAILDRL